MIPKSPGNEAGWLCCLALMAELTVARCLLLNIQRNLWLAPPSTNRGVVSVTAGEVFVQVNGVHSPF